MWPAGRDQVRRMTLRLRAGMSCLLFGAALISAGGCSDSKYETTPVQGVVLCGGTPVSGGNLTLSPIPEPGDHEPGKTAVAVVQENGKFELATYGRNDGAIIGRHRVLYSVPDARPGTTPCGEMVVQEIEIFEGIAEITIELSKR